MKTKPNLKDINRILTKSPVLLPLPNKQKGPRLNGWQTFTYEDTQNPGYQQALRGSTNIGVLLGARSYHLCAIDFDTDAALDDFLATNPILANSLQVQGERGAQVYAYFEGKRPDQVFKLKVNASSVLAAGKIPDDHGMVQIGEFRAEGGQSVLVGEHPHSNPPDNPIWYSWLIDSPPVTISFDQIIWHPDIHLPWANEEPGHETKTTNEKSALQMAIEKLTIDFLWDHFGYGPKKGNPVRSPFRNESNPSFSIYRDKNGKQRFKDHGQSDHRGDSFDFFQLAIKKDSHEAFKPFLELAGMLEPELELGEEIFEETLKARERYRRAVELKPPPIGEDAYVGFAGDWIKFLELQTECNRDNLLVQFLAGVGAEFGRYHFNYYGQNLFTNLFVVILGDSGMARKGTALNYVKDWVRIFDPEWRGIRGGWASGEALVHFARDPEMGFDRKKKEEFVRDPGVTDKRILVAENELFQVFRIGDRQGNNLIVKLREAWDSPEFMANTNKNSPQIATAPHISMIGHMTKAELLTTDPSNISNGFINRILWIHAFRARLIANPEPITWPAELVERFRLIRAFALGPQVVEADGTRGLNHIPLDPNAKLLWEKIYYEAPTLSGSLGAILERFTSQIRKVALIYALLDQSNVITRTHLLAGQAIAIHSRDCVKLTFATFTPSKNANKILMALRQCPEGMNRTVLREYVFNNHTSSADVTEALSSLALNGLAEVKVFKTKGRPIENWYATK